MISAYSNQPQARKSKLVWLIGLLFLTFSMITLGGLTRLTDSGLSMVHWKIITGILPPLNFNDWMKHFEAYQQFPEFQKINHQMNLQEFKTIFYFEYSHRILGRILGLMVLLPTIYFWIKQQLLPKEKKNFIALFILVLLQGLLGWYMVKSGLINHPSVSHFRLAVHFFTALIFFGYTTYLTLNYYYFSIFQKSSGFSSNNPIKSVLSGYFYLLLNVTIFFFLLQTIYGTFLAGLDAGLVSNTYPKMFGKWFPLSIFENFTTFIYLITENSLFIHFIHRHLGLVVAILLLTTSLLTFKAWNKLFLNQKDLKFMQTISIILLLMAIVQPLLGILSVIHQIPVALASFHQIIAVFIFESLLIIKWRLNFQHKL